MYINYITYNCLMAIRHGCLWFMKYYETKDNWKRNATQSIKSPPLWYCSGLFPLKRRYYYAFIAQKCKKKNL
jgi:hypothetical protein